MSFFGFNKRAKHRRFDFIPRFYDPVKEELESRLETYKDQEIDAAELAKKRIQSGLRTKYRVDQNYQSSQRSKSNRTLLYTIIVLSFLTYLLMQSDSIVRLIEKF